MLIKLLCTGCGKSRRDLVNSEDELKDLDCSCGGRFERNPDPPLAHVKETLDNGAMVRSLERFQNAEELGREHAASDPRHQRV